MENIDSRGGGNSNFMVMEKLKFIVPINICQDQIEVKKSRFIGRIHPVSDKDEAESLINSIKEEYADATHNCWAWHIEEKGLIHYRFSDDGEPSGTAGKPILASIEEKNITDCLIVVTRYFGGIKLGMGGLSRAYRQCARGVIAGGKFRRKQNYLYYIIIFPYSYEQPLRRLCEDSEVKIVEAGFTDKVCWKLKIAEEANASLNQRLIDICRGEIEIQKTVMDGWDRAPEGCWDALNRFTKQ